MYRRSLVLLAPGAASAQLNKIFDKIFKGATSGPHGDNKIVDGLKEALRVGTGNAITLAGRLDGYFANTLIRILMPEKLRAWEKGMRLIGMGKQVDGFVLSMNRAAEAAAPLARDIFFDAIQQMTFDDARKLLTGSGDTAATDFFQAKTTGKLTETFRPAVAKTMAENQVGRNFQNVLNAARKFPLFKSEAIDMESYVVAKSLDGLFLLIGKEERKIRKDPAARVSSILKEVFSI